MEINSDRPLVLIVDDNNTNLQVLGNMLRDHGFKPAAASNGRDAIDFAAKKNPEVILLDAMMPELDGFETCRILRENESTRGIPVIFITALTGADDKLRAFRAGGVDYITKPFMAEEVVARIDVHVKLRRTLLKLENMALVDEMTGVFNRRFAYDNIHRLVEHSRRNKYKLVVCYMDLDNLKTVNDRFGHQSGDDFIRKLVNAVRNTVRESDLIFRMGGDEFMVIFPETVLDGAKKIMSRVSDSLKNSEVSGVPVEFSYGFAEYDPLSALTADDLIKMADREMYKEKQRRKKG